MQISDKIVHGYKVTSVLDTFSGPHRVLPFLAYPQRPLFWTQFTFTTRIKKKSSVSDQHQYHNRNITITTQSPFRMLKITVHSVVYMPFNAWNPLETISFELVLNIKTHLSLHIQNVNRRCRHVVGSQPPTSTTSNTN